MQELSHWQEISPLCGLTLTEDPEVGFQVLINLLEFAISLGIISSEEGDIVERKASEFLSKGKSELETMVKDDFMMETKASKDMFEKEGGNTSSIDEFGTRNENHPLC